MGTAKRLAILALAWLSAFAATEVRLSSKDGMLSAGQSQVVGSVRAKPGAVAIAAEKTIDLKTHQIKIQTVRDEAPWVPPASGEEAYRLRFETPDKKVVSQIAVQAPPLQPVAQVPAQPTPFAPVPIVRVTNIPPGSKRVALTFDVEKDAGAVPAILAALKAAGVKATFFMTGLWAESYPELVKQMADEGHEIANHSYNHPMFTKLPDESVFGEIIATEGRVFAVTGRQPARLFRPPYGDFDSRILGLAASKGFRTVMWSNDPADWRSWQNPANVYALVTDNLKDGDIILLHSSSLATGGAIPEILKKFQALGFGQVTVSELLGP